MFEGQSLTTNKYEIISVTAGEQQCNSTVQRMTWGALPLMTYNRRSTLCKRTACFVQFENPAELHFCTSPEVSATFVLSARGDPPCTSIAKREQLN